MAKLPTDYAFNFDGFKKGLIFAANKFRTYYLKLLSGLHRDGVAHFIFYA